MPIRLLLRRAALAAVAVCLLLAANPSQAGDIGGPLVRMLTPDVPRAIGTTWVVSTREAPQLDGCSNCRATFLNRDPVADCYRAPLARAQVFRRERCGQLTRCRLDDLKAALDPSRPTVIFIHGSFVSFDFFVAQSPQSQRYFECGAGRPLNVIFFTWPGDGCVPTCAAAVRIRERRARTNAFYLAELLRCTETPGCGQPTLLVSHSHGGEMVAATLHLIAGGRVAGRRLAYRPATRPRSLLFAPAMDSNDLNPGQAFDCALRATPAMAVVYSRKDVATSLYPLRRLGSPWALGHIGLTDRNVARIGPVARRVHNLNVTPIIGHRHQWGEYLTHPEIIAALRSYFR